MANTERLKVMGLVHDAKLQVEKALNAKEWPTPQRKTLERLADLLGTIEDDLFVAELSARVQKLKERSTALAKLNRQLEKEIQGVKGVAKAVDKAAEAIKVLAKIAKLSAGLG